MIQATIFMQLQDEALSWHLSVAERRNGRGNFCEKWGRPEYPSLPKGQNTFTPPVGFL
jgi:hypothetical protein